MTDRLPRAIRDKAGKTISTHTEAKRHVMAKLEARPDYQSWRHAAELLVQDADAERIATQIEYALLLDGQLDMRK